MRNLLHPRWLLIVNTVPVMVLFFLFYTQYNIIGSLLKPESIALWKMFGINLAILAFINLGYAAYLILSKRTVHILYAAFMLIIYVVFVYWYSTYSSEIIPFGIPRWMVPGDMFLYVGTFLMPTMAYALLILVVHFTQSQRNPKPWKSFLMAIGVPALWFIIVQVMIPLRKQLDLNYNNHVIGVFFIAGTVLFLFFLIRFIYILITRKSAVWKKYELFWKIPIVLVLPLIGLSLNNGDITSEFSSGVFGDFSSVWFYVLIVINGILLCLPNLEKRSYRILLFIGRTILFAFTLYFFLVFLPFLPFSVLAIIVMGTGFLMLAPLMLFVIHINELASDYKYLRQHLAKKMLPVISMIGFLVIPGFLTLSFLNDKATLEHTLNYLYEPDYTVSYDLDKESLKSTLQVIKKHKDRNGAFIFGSQTPYISTYFNWLVLDNLTLSDSKINYIEKVFFRKPSFNVRGRSENINNGNVTITNTTVESTYDETEKVWKSWINLEITNGNEGFRNAEYSTIIDLPVGCWISDYYLYVGERKEMGILAEKKAAMWVFSQIRNENRDPGILYYLTGNKVSFRVFPFTKEEVRKTGIEFIHKEPVSINLDGNLIKLGNPKENPDDAFENDDIAYVPVSKKQTLRKVQRKPYFHFLVDGSSSENALSKEEIEERISALLNKYPDLKVNSKVSKVNSYVTTKNIDDSWQSLFMGVPSGGFFLDRAIKNTLVNSFKTHSDNYPVMVVVANDIEHAIIDKDFSDLAVTFPEMDNFYHLIDSDSLMTHSLLKNPILPIIEKEPSFFKSSLEFISSDNKSHYISVGSTPSIVLKKDFISINEDSVKEKDWETALQLNGNWTSQNLNPSKPGEWLSLVRASFLSRVMSPVTSYLVVENEAQKAILKKKQEQILSSNKSLDPGEDLQRMSEPSWIIIIILMSLFYYFRRKSRNKRKMIL